MLKEIVIDLSAGGQAQALHMDEFPLGFLGKMRMERASNLVFNESTQLWDVVLPQATTARASGFRSYELARDFEVEFLQTCRTLRVDPASEKADKYVTILRPAYDRD